MSLEDRLTQLEARRGELEEEISHRQVELVGVRAQIEAVRGRLDGSTGPSEGGSRTERVRRILELAKHPLSPTEIVEALAEGGDEAGSRDVRGTLSYLKQQGLAVHVGRAQWTAAHR